MPLCDPKRTFAKIELRGEGGALTRRRVLHHFFMSCSERVMQVSAFD
jgi:hypothetical protein